MKDKIKSVDPTIKFLSRNVVDKTIKWDKYGEEMIDDGFPLQLDIELTTACNLKCRMCVQSKMKLKPEYMERKMVYDLLRQGVENDLDSVKLNYRGEPLMHPNFVEIVKYAKDLGLYVHFNTNGLLMDSKNCKALIEAKVDEVFFSIDSCVEETYEKIRINGRFGVLLMNIAQLRVLRALKGVDLPVISLQCVKQELNREEIESGAFEKFWTPLVDHIAICDEFDLMDGSIDATPLRDWHCGQIWQRLIVLVDGRVLPCCCGYDYSKDKAYPLGNAKGMPIKKIWKHPIAKNLKMLHRRGLSHLVKMCTVCRLRKNVIQQELKTNQLMALSKLTKENWENMKKEMVGNHAKL